MEEYKSKLEAILRKLFQGEQSGHDIYHLVRVSNLALCIQKNEGGDRDVVGVAAFLHDIHRLMQNETGVFVHPKDSLPQIREILQTIHFSIEKTEKVLHCIEFHEEYPFSKNGKSVTDLETLLLQDADNLDAIGAIGIGRTFTYMGAHGYPMWEPSIPLLDENTTFDETVVADPSTIHHFYHKLFRLAETMNTTTGKKIALERQRVMRQFVETFFQEWEGER